MRVAALTRGAGVPAGDFDGSVAETHRRACLIALTDDRWLTLASADLGALPGGITLAVPESFSFRMLPVTASAAARGGVLRVGGGALSVDLRGTTAWRSDLGALRIDLGTDATRAAWQAARDALDADGRIAGLRGLAADAIGALDHAAHRGDLAAAERAMARLVGLGAGRTPAGDDFLVGFLAGLRARRIATGPDRILEALQAQVPRLAERTTRVSQLYLRAAAAGEISQRLHAVGAALAAGSDRASVERAVAVALAVGHDSGAAGVLGLLHGCAVQQVKGAA